MFFLVVALNRPSQSLILDEIRQSHVCVATANFGATGLFLPLVLGLNHANNGFLFIGVATHFIFHWLLHFQLCNGADEVGLALGHNHIFINSFRAIGFSVCLKTIWRERGTLLSLPGLRAKGRMGWDEGSRGPRVSGVSPVLGALMHTNSPAGEMGPCLCLRKQTWSRERTFSKLQRINL